jgi:hypothetical protein
MYGGAGPEIYGGAMGRPTRALARVCELVCVLARVRGVGLVRGRWRVCHNPGAGTRTRVTSCMPTRVRERKVRPAGFFCREALILVYDI